MARKKLTKTEWIMLGVGLLFLSLIAIKSLNLGALGGCLPDNAKVPDGYDAVEICCAGYGHLDPVGRIDVYCGPPTGAGACVPDGNIAEITQICCSGNAVMCNGVKHCGSYNCNYCEVASKCVYTQCRANNPWCVNNCDEFDHIIQTCASNERCSSGQCVKLSQSDTMSGEQMLMVVGFTALAFGVVALYLKKRK